MRNQFTADMKILKDAASMHQKNVEAFEKAIDKLPASEQERFRSIASSMRKSLSEFDAQGMQKVMRDLNNIMSNANNGNK